MTASWDANNKLLTFSTGRVAYIPLGGVCCTDGPHYECYDVDGDQIETVESGEYESKSLRNEELLELALFGRKHLDDLIMVLAKSGDR